MSCLTLEKARAAVNAALKKAEELQAKMNIAVVDAGGIVAQYRAFQRRSHSIPRWGSDSQLRGESDRRDRRLGQCCRERPCRGAGGRGGSEIVSRVGRAVRAPPFLMVVPAGLRTALTPGPSPDQPSVGAHGRGEA